METDKLKKTYGPGEFIFCEYEKGDYVYIIISGKVRIFKTAAGKEFVLAVLGPGSVFGEMAIISGDVRNASAEAIEETELFRLKQDDFQRLYQTHPELIMKLIYEIAKRINRVSKQIEILTLDKIELRVAAVLATTGRTENPITRPIPLLASLAGLTEQEFENGIKQLEKENLVKVNIDQSIYIRNFEIMLSKIKVYMKKKKYKQ